MKIKFDLKNKANETLSLVALLLFLFVAHRCLAFVFLNQEVPMPVSRFLDTFFVGMLSDFWIAVLLGVLVFTLSAIFSFVPQRLCRYMNIALLSSVVLLLYLHQGYVEFFGIQILPFHFKYMIDKEFLSANGVSLPSYTQISFLLISAATFMIWIRFRRLLNFYRPLQLFFLVAVLAVVAHTLNIRWRVQHFIQESMQVNVFEHLYAKSIKQVALPRLTQEEMNQLAKKLHKSGIYQPNYADLVLWPTKNSKLNSQGEAIKKLFQKKINANAKPIALVVLLESSRPSDTSAFSSTPPALTPSIDLLGTTGLTYKNAYSVGTVTRSGQEAVWCGTLSSMYSSLMRERTDIQWNCLPRVLVDVAESFWFHGGDPNFDGQTSFWKKQGVEHLLTRRDFPEIDDGKGWGVSDHQLFQRSVREMIGMRHASKKKALVGQILTVTNHIPWKVPVDLEASLPTELFEKIHPSAKTTNYVDTAVGRFVKELKEKQLWQDTLIFFVSDHGAKMPPTFDIYANDKNPRAKLMTHINLVVSGGIAEEALKLTSPLHLERRATSQASIAPFLANLFTKSHDFFAESLFVESPRAPVISQLEDGYFLPESQSWFARSNLQTVNVAGLDPEQRKEYEYLISFLNYMENPRRKHD